MYHKSKKWRVAVTMAMCGCVVCIASALAATHGIAVPEKTVNVASTPPMKASQRSVYSWTFGEGIENGWTYPEGVVYYKNYVEVPYDKADGAAFLSPELDLSACPEEVTLYFSGDGEMDIYYSENGTEWNIVDYDYDFTNGGKIPKSAKRLKIQRSVSWGDYISISNVDIIAYDNDKDTDDKDPDNPFGGVSYGEAPYNWIFYKGQESGWTLPEDVTYYSSDEYAGSLCSSGTIVSPEIDLSSYTTPLLRIDLKKNKFELSCDGVDWFSIYGNILPKSVKYIRVQAPDRLAGIQIVDLRTQEEYDFALNNSKNDKSDIYRAIYEPSSFTPYAEVVYDFNGDGKMDLMRYEWNSKDGKTYGLYISQGFGYVRYKCDALKDLLGSSREGKVYRFRDTDIYYSYLGGTLFSFRCSGDGNVESIDKAVSGGTAYPIDADNDGQTDFMVSERLSSHNEEVYTISTDGKFYKSNLSIYTPPVDESDEGEQSSGCTFVTMDYSQLSPGAIMGQMFGRDGSGSSGTSGSIAGGAFQASDLNGDGIPDFINFNSGNAYYGLPNGMFINEQFDGQMFIADFNADGIEDYVLFHDSKLTVYLQQGDGTTKSKDLVSGFSCSNIWCRDVDNDGDPDMIMALNGSMSFLAVFVNDGKGSFKRHEAALPEDCGKFVACIDYDNDGLYEVMTDMFTAFKIDGAKVDVTPIDLHKHIDAELYPGYAADGLAHDYVLDLATGKMRLGSKYVESDYVWLTLPENKRPSAPTKAPEITYESSTGLLKISWTKGTDTETPASDLTYNLRIGTGPDSDNILATYSMADGTHLLAEEGNMGRQVQRIINTRSWPSATYYVSVQTVDGNFRGSEFSPAAKLEKTEPENDFFISHRNPLNILDTVNVVVKTPVAGNILEWNLDGGRLIATDEATGVCKVVFDTPGSKNISLQVTDAKGVKSAILSKELTVSRGTAHCAQLIGLAAGFDIDEDGTPEYYNAVNKVNSPGPKMFYQRDGKGSYEKIPKMFNSQNGVGQHSLSPLTADLNGDGMCDLWSYNSSNIICTTNLGDMDMETTVVSASQPNSQNRWLDFNNDGKYDVVNGYGDIYMNDGSYCSFKNTGIYGDSFYDFDGDGLIDVFTLGANENGPSVYVFLNQGDNTLKYLGDVNVDTREKLVCAQDFDGDGNVDLLFNDCIIWNDGNKTDLPEEVGYNRWDGINYMKDVDNNGTLDIVKGSSVIYIMPNREVVLENYDKNDWEDHCYYYFDSWNNKYYDNFDNFFVGSDGTMRNALLEYRVNNTAPSAPTNVRHSQNEGFVTVEWTHAYDKETPASNMLYNVSIKHAGAEGEGAYLFSPANSGKNGVPLPSSKPLLQGNKLKIPVANIPAGEYEVKVQARDLAYAVSDFSETYTMRVLPSASFDLPATGEVNVPVPVKVLINTDIPVDFGGGVDQGQVSGVHQVVWDTPGTKTLSVGDAVATIYIQPAPDGSFTLPQSARKGDRINVSGKLMNSGTWEAAELFTMWSPAGIIDTEQSIHDPYKKKELQYVDDKNALFIPYAYGRLRLKHSVSSRFSTQTYKQEVRIDADPEYTGSTYAQMKAETPSTISLKYVTVDSETGKYKLEWNAIEKHREEATGINVYREGAVTDRYELLATLPLDATEYVDANSNPDVKTERYVLAYQLSYGISRYCAAHSPAHVMINRGAGSSWNLIWGSYTGTVVKQYRILRGSSPESLVAIAEVSGHTASYTDFTAPAGGALYYAVETVFEDDEQPLMSNLPAAHKPSSAAPRSNIVAAAGGNITFAESLRVFSETGETTIDASNPQPIRLVAVISPVTATFGRVAWSVISGEELATVDNSGRVTATKAGSGVVTVRASSIDGSGLAADITINISGFSGIERPEVATGQQIHAFPSPAVTTVTINGLPGHEVELYVFSMGGAIVEQITTEATAVTLDCSAWPAGIYIAKTVDAIARKEAAVKFVKK